MRFLAGKLKTRIQTYAKNIYYLFAVYCYNGYANEPQCYLICMLPLLSPVITILEWRFVGYCFVCDYVYVCVYVCVYMCVCVCAHVCVTLSHDSIGTHGSRPSEV